MDVGSLRVSDDKIINQMHQSSFLDYHNSAAKKFNWNVSRIFNLNFSYGKNMLFFSSIEKQENARKLKEF